MKRNNLWYVCDAGTNLLTPAEKQYRERIKADPEIYRTHVASEKKRWNSRKKVGNLALIADKTPREQRQTRRIWKKAKAESRKRKKNQEALTTPPTTPTASQFETPESRQKVEGKRRKKKCEKYMKTSIRLRWRPKKLC